MNTIEAFKSSESKSFKKNNPHLFQVGGANVQNPNREHPSDCICYLCLPGLHAKPKAKKRIRQSNKPLLNKLETEWFCRIPVHYEARPQALKLRLANGVFYKPDFFSLKLRVAWEVKGLKGKNIDRGKLALKVAATIWPDIKFFLVWKDESGQWQEQHILP